MDAADRGEAANRIGQRGESREMSADGMATDKDALRIAVPLVHVLEYPTRRRANLAHDLRNRDVRCERIVDADDGDAGRYERFGYVAEVALVESPPPAAVHEYENRRAGRRRGEEIELF